MGGPTVDNYAVSGAQLLERWSGAADEPLWKAVFEDGARYVPQRGRAGDHLIEYATRPAFHLSDDRLILSCVDPHTQAADWQRTLADTGSVERCAAPRRRPLARECSRGAHRGSRCRGHAGPARAPSRRQLALDGWPLVTDDILAVERRGARIITYPGPSLVNLSLGLRPQLAPEALGEVLATFRSPASLEAPVLVRNVSEGELPLAAVVLLKRAGRQAARVARLSATTLDLAAHTLAFRKMAGAPRRRFEAVRDIVERVPLFLYRGRRRGASDGARRSAALRATQ